MEIINCCKAFIIGVFFTLIIFFTGVIIKDKKPINKIHFYVVRNNSEAQIYGSRYSLFLGKPLRMEENGEKYWASSVQNHCIWLCYGVHFKCFGLNINDFRNLKWEDEPVEVFVNLKA